MLATPSLAPTPREYPVSRLDGTGTPFMVRPFLAADRAALEAFYDQFEPKRAAQGLPPLGLERVRRWLNSVLPTGLHLLAFRDDELIGHALLVPTPQPGMHEYAVFLRADQRGRGVGTQLNLLTVEAARSAGLQRLWLSVEPHNRPAIRSYEKAGFRFRPGSIYAPELEMELELPTGGPSS